MSTLPVIDMAALFVAEDKLGHERVACEIQAACRSSGFFYVTGHGVVAACVAELERASHVFFGLPFAQKMRIAMRHGGLAWRGYFPVGGELTSGAPDQKEGIYFGTELPANHPRVLANTPLHGANLWPAAVPELQGPVMEYMRATTRAAQALLRGVALSLQLPADYFVQNYTAEPTVLFRIFHYPPPTRAETPSADSAWGVGEHTDYGLLTLLAQDRLGGLQVRSEGCWIDAPPIEGALVCNIGDMLDRLTGGWYRSTPHRVKNTSGESRLSFPLFFDPDFAAEMQPLPEAGVADAGRRVEPRWDNVDLQAFEGTYGDYLLGKVAKVFPELVDWRDSEF